MTFYFYLARCQDDSLYAGYCKNLADRETAHNNGTGAKYTRARGPVTIVHAEIFSTKSEAMKREYAAKKLSKQAKESLVKNTDFKHA